MKTNKIGFGKLKLEFIKSVEESKFYPSMKFLAGELKKKYSARTYIVGGTIRDFIVESRNKIEDIDLCVENCPGNEALENLLTENGKITRNMLGGFKWFPDNRVSKSEEQFDIDIWRTEVGVMPDEKPTIENVLKRFDLNINSVAWDIEEEKFIDPLKGMDILLNLNNESKIEVLTEKVHKNNEGRLILRAVKYASRLGLDITDRSKHWIKENERYLDEMTDERINYVLRSIDCLKYKKEIEERLENWLSPQLAGKVLKILYK